MAEKEKMGQRIRKQSQHNRVAHAVSKEWRMWRWVQQLGGLSTENLPAYRLGGVLIVELRGEVSNHLLTAKPTIVLWSMGQQWGLGTLRCQSYLSVNAH
jgi:hypothetical protein